MAGRSIFSGQQMIGAKAGIDGEQLLKAAQQQRRAEQDHDGERQFARRKNVAQTAASADDRALTVAQTVVQSGSERAAPGNS